MHVNGYCHRDLKPENCMIERASNNLKVIDFGLSKHLESVVTLGIGAVCPTTALNGMRRENLQTQVRTVTVCHQPTSDSRVLHGPQVPAFEIHA